MSRLTTLWLGLPVLGLVLATTASAQTAPTPDPNSYIRVVASGARLPLLPNAGQWVLAEEKASPGAAALRVWREQPALMGDFAITLMKSPMFCNYFIGRKSNSKDVKSLRATRMPARWEPGGVFQNASLYLCRPVGDLNILVEVKATAHASSAASSPTAVRSVTLTEFDALVPVLELLGDEYARGVAAELAAAPPRPPDTGAFVVIEGTSVKIPLAPNRGQWRAFEEVKSATEIKVTIVAYSVQLAPYSLVPREYSEDNRSYEIVFRQGNLPCSEMYANLQKLPARERVQPLLEDRVPAGWEKPGLSVNDDKIFLCRRTGKMSMAATVIETPLGGPPSAAIREDVLRAIRPLAPVIAALGEHYAPQASR